MEKGKVLGSSQELLRMLLLAVPLKVVRSRKCLATIWNMTSEGTFPVNSIDMAAEIFLQCKSLDMCATGNVALERALVDLQVFTTNGVNIES